MKRLFTLLLTLYAVSLSAQRVDTVSVLSLSMGKEIKNVVILPASYSAQPARRYPVLYLLHGHNGSYASWIRLSCPTLPALASAAEMIMVCPDGGHHSWYWDSPVDPTMRYDTYVSRELVSWVDSHYRTIGAPTGRAVTGFSMGGHGGLWLGFTHQDVYGACGSMAGGVDITPFPDNWEMYQVLGNYRDNRKVWEEHTVTNQIWRLTPGAGPAIVIDCGTGDFFYKVNEQLHGKLLAAGIDHEYTTRPGSHTHAYWGSAVEGQILFFRKFFYPGK